jgi:hypothetical protein
MYIISWQEKLLLRARSYVYHPALLEIIVSGGPVAIQSEGSNDLLFGYDVTLNALARKPYPFSVYFRQGYPDTATGSAGRFQVETNQYGVQGFVRPRRSPIFLSWQAERRDSYGAGFDTIVDSNSDNALLNVSLPYGTGQNLALNLNWNRLESRNGSAGLPIFETSSTSRTSRLSGENVFGENKQVSIRQALHRIQQDVDGSSDDELDKLDYFGNLSWRHSDRHRSYGNYVFSDTDRNGEESRSHGLTATTNFKISPRLNTTLTSRFSSNEREGYSQGSIGGVMRARFSRDLSFGRLVLNGSYAVDRRDQETTRDSVSVFDEPATLNSVDPVPLRENFIIVETVIVTNADRTQTFIEDIDYRLVTIGDVTTIERLVTGNIFDGQVVLVSYEFLTGGTVKYGRASQSFTTALNMPRVANLFFAISKTENDVLSGEATTPLNDSRQYEFSATRSHSFSRGWLLNAEVRLVNVEEDISPLVRTSYSLSVGLPRFRSARVSLGVFREFVDYEFSREDVDQIRYTIDVSGRLPWRFFFNYRGTSGENDGGSFYRQDERHNLQIAWRYRRVSFFMNAIQSDVFQGGSNRKDLRVTANIQRYF